MRLLVTGSSGHLGEALVRVLRTQGRDVVGLDARPSPTTDLVGSVTDRALVREAVSRAGAVLHTATLHKPDVRTSSRQDFVDTNVTGTLALLEESAAAGVGAFVLTSTTSTYGRALTPPDGEPAVWVDEDLVPVPRNVYGATKRAAEDLGELVARDEGLPVVVLRASRFFPEGDDREDVRRSGPAANVKANELLHRRVDLQDVVDAHLLAVERAPALGHARYVVSAPTPFTRADAPRLRVDAPGLVRSRFPDQPALYAQQGWRVPDGIERVYDSSRAQRELGWRPRYDFRHLLDSLAAGEDPRSPLARQVGAKGYHGAPTWPGTT